MDLKFWQKALREAERELDAATTALNTAAKKFMRAKAELKRLQAEAPIWRGAVHPPPSGIDDQTRSLKRLL